jgi:hypothetical protein
MSNVLVVANQTLAGEEISEFVKISDGEEAPEFRLLVPATARTPHREQSARLFGNISGGVPRQHAVHRAEDAADYEQARVRLESGLSKLRLLAATVDGIVGDPNPFKAISEVF